jgi:DNA repair exonuclease SbcCD ATPase subunit
MARLGITYDDVANAAETLMAQGKPPTIQNIRLLTNTGSSTTIAQHLKAWKSQHGSSRALGLTENLPEEIVRPMKGLWAQVIHHAEEKIAAREQAFEQATAAITDQNKKLEEENTGWQKKYDALTQEKEKQMSEQWALEQAVRQLEQEKVALTVTCDHLAQQLQEKQAHMQELHRLNHQIQTNLEHYREASREQRLRDQQHYEQAQRQQEHAIQQLAHELKTLGQEKNALYEALEQVRAVKKALKSQYDALVVQNDVIKSQLEAAQKEVIQQAQAEHHWQAHSQKTEEKLEAQSAVLLTLQTQQAVLLHQCLAAQTELQEMSHQNQCLVHDKWKLSQENAQLAGQLKPWETLAEK